MTEPILFHRDGAVLVVVINNPGARNALTPALYAALPIALRDAERDPTVGAIVLTGAGNTFCSGGDLRQLKQRRGMTAEAQHAMLERLHDLIRAIRDCSKPVIAAVEGAAAGAGLSIALACDMLIAARDATFSVAYVKVGLSPDGGATAFLAACVSRQILTELCLTGERIAAERMDRFGMINRLTEPGQALGEAVTLGQAIARGPQRAMARIKTLCRHAGESALETQLDREAATMVASLSDSESAEGIEAFLTKRPADFMRLRHEPEGALAPPSAEPS